MKAGMSGDQINQWLINEINRRESLLPGHKATQDHVKIVHIDTIDTAEGGDSLKQALSEFAQEKKEHLIVTTNITTNRTTTANTANGTPTNIVATNIAGIHVIRCGNGEYVVNVLVDSKSFSLALAKLFKKTIEQSWFAKDSFVSQMSEFLLSIRNDNNKQIGGESLESLQVKCRRSELTEAEATVVLESLIGVIRDASKQKDASLVEEVRSFVLSIDNTKVENELITRWQEDCKRPGLTEEEAMAVLDSLNKKSKECGLKSATQFQSQEINKDNAKRFLSAFKKVNKIKEAREFVNIPPINKSSTDADKSIVLGLVVQGLARSEHELRGKLAEKYQFNICSISDGSRAEITTDSLIMQGLVELVNDGKIINNKLQTSEQLYRDIEDAAARSASSISSRTESQRALSYNSQEILKEFLPDTDLGGVVFSGRDRILNKIASGTKTHGAEDANPFLAENIYQVLDGLGRDHDVFIKKDHNHPENIIVGKVLIEFEVSPISIINALKTLFGAESEDLAQFLVKVGCSGISQQDLSTQDSLELYIHNNQVELDTADILEVLILEQDGEKKAEQYKRILYKTTTQEVIISREEGASYDNSYEEDTSRIVDAVNKNYNKLKDKIKAQTASLQTEDKRGLLSQALNNILSDSEITKKFKPGDLEKIIGDARQELSKKDGIVNMPYVLNFWGDRLEPAYKFLRQELANKLHNEFADFKRRKSEIVHMGSKISAFEDHYGDKSATLMFGDDIPIDQNKIRQEVPLIRGHSESDLVSNMRLDFAKQPVKKDKIKSINVVLLSTNESCSACTNVIPGIREKVMEKISAAYNSQSDHENDSSSPVVRLFYVPLKRSEANIIRGVEIKDDSSSVDVLIEGGATYIFDPMPIQNQVDQSDTLYYPPSPSAAFRSIPIAKRVLKVSNSPSQTPE